MMTVAGKQEVDLNAEKKRSQLLEVWRRLKKSKVAIVGLVILFFLIFIAVFADLLVDYNVAIKQDLVHKLQGPSAEHWLGPDFSEHRIYCRDYLPDCGRGHRIHRRLLRGKAGHDRHAFHRCLDVDSVHADVHLCGDSPGARHVQSDGCRYHQLCGYLLRHRPFLHTDD